MDLDTLKTISANYLKELNRASNGEKTSLAFINNPLPAFSAINNEDVFQVMVIGGSVFQSALVKKAGQGIEIIRKTENRIPVMQTKEIFLSFLINCLEPDVNILAVNFAYAVMPVFRDGKLDGKFVGISKGHNFDGLYGENVGEAIEKYIHERTQKNINVYVANDTVCLLMSALTDNIFNKLACGIVGTGVNFAFFNDKTNVINTESKTFDKFPVLKITSKLDVDSLLERDFFELEVSGAYLYKQFNARLKENKIDYPPIKASVELNDISISNTPEISDIAKNIIKRSAHLVACVISGITLYKKQDMFFVMEGSVFWKGYEYKKTVEETIKEIIPEYKVTFTKVENSDIIGAAKLVC